MRGTARATSSDTHPKSCRNVIAERGIELRVRRGELEYSPGLAGLEQVRGGAHGWRPGSGPPCLGWLRVTCRSVQRAIAKLQIRGAPELGPQPQREPGNAGRRRAHGDEGGARSRQPASASPSRCGRRHLPAPLTANHRRPGRRRVRRWGGGACGAAGGSGGDTNAPAPGHRPPTPRVPRELPGCAGGTRREGWGAWGRGVAGAARTRRAAGCGAVRRGGRDREHSSTQPDLTSSHP